MDATSTNDGASRPKPGPHAGAEARPGARLIVARLIRRLRVSDPPERFQRLATNALRAATGARAVAWVPGRKGEPVVVSGETGAARPEDLRALTPALPSVDGLLVDNRPATSGRADYHALAGAAADSQGSLGWLLALDPPGGRPSSEADAELLAPVAALIATQQLNARFYADLKDLLFGVIRALTAAVDAKDPYTSGHSERVARIAVRLGEQLGMSPNQRGDLYLTGLLHDIGKIGVDDAVLKKPGPLTPEEYRQIQAHVEIGVHILSGLKKLTHLLPGVRHHHESLDGSGYPSRLVGDAIPLEARILAVADSFDAMSSTRPYRRRLGLAQIDDILRSGSGRQWDPSVIDALFSCRADVEAIRQKGLGESLQAVVSETLGRSRPGAG
jgi:HD-GYP domain-containing protein (c-di-GMP phosphodiesterase class II)